jgi:hypothetical protein
MYLMHKPSGDLIEVLSLDRLFDPYQTEVNGRFHVGVQLPEPAAFGKGDLLFPSGEYLPRCWVDPMYKTKLRAVRG